MSFTPPPSDCPLCPRLAVFRCANRSHYPDYFNAPVPPFGELSAELLVVGLAPGLKGANQTGRPFTGDYAGLVLYSALKKKGFAQGDYHPEKVAGRRFPAAQGQKPAATDGLQLVNCRITNSVRCVPPQNKPEPSEIKTCNRFLKDEIKAMPRLKVILSLGLVAHKAVLMALELKQSSFAFKHSAKHNLHLASCNLQLLNSYHCSRYNINTGVLTQAMFDEVVESAKRLL